MEAPSASTSSFSPGHHYPAAVAKYSTPIVATAPRQQLPSPSSTFHSHLPQPSPASPYRLCTMSTIRYEYDENLPPPSSSHAPQLVNRPSPISPPTSLLASEMQIIHADFATDELDDFVNDHAGDRSFDLARYVTAHNDEGDGEWNRENLLLHNCTPSIDPTLMGDDKLVSIINDVASLPPNQVALLPAVHRHSSYHPSPFAVIGGNNQQPLQSAGEVQGVHYFHQRHRHRSEKQGLTGGDDNDENAGPGMDTTYHPRPAAYGETYCVLSTSSSDYHPLQRDQRLHHSLPHHSQHPQHNVPVFHQQHVIVSGGDEEPEEEFLLAPEDFVANEEDSQHSDFIADSSFSAQGEGTQPSTSNKRGTKRRSDEVSTHSGDSGGGNGSGGGGSGGTRRQQPKTGNVDEQQIAGGFIKPSYSYSCLIGLALKNSTSGELTVSEIYAFLCEHFPFFRAAPGGWKNSVRHNLSLNKCFQKIEVETPGCQGRKSCLWRLNPAKEAKMDLELRKWRDRYEPTILKSMCNPDDLDSIQNGTKGMPPTMRRRIFATSDENYTATVKTVQPKIIRRLPLHPSSTSSNRPGFSTPLAAASTSSNATNKLASGGGSGASRREDAARKLELLLQQTKSGQFETSPPLAPKRSSTGSRHSSSSTSSQHFQVKTSPPDFNISVSTPTHGAPSSQHQHEKKSRAHSKECKQEICQSDMSVLLPMSLLESRDDHLHHGTPLSRGEFHSPFGESTTSHHRIFSGRLVVRSGGESRALRMEDANCYTLQTTPKGEVSPMGEGGLESPAPSGRRLPQSRFNTPSTSFASSYDIATDAINNNSLLELEGLNTPSSNPSLRREPLREIKKEIP